MLLYVTAATTDLVTGQTIEFIDTHDPDWERTMTIVTKIDRRDENFINNFKLIDKGLGAYCVRNRTQGELNRAIPFSEALQLERAILSEDDFS